LVKPRVAETNEGIQGEFTVEEYDLIMRNIRYKGWIETELVFKTGINHGMCLEVGPGPGYLGLEWPSKTGETNLRPRD